MSALSVFNFLVAGSLFYQAISYQYIPGWLRLLLIAFAVANVWVAFL